MVAIADGYKITVDKAQVLVVEEDWAVIGMITRILQRDYEIFSACDFSQARHILERQDIEIIICDHGLSDGNGLDFLKRVYQEYPKILRVLLSGPCENYNMIREASENIAHIFLSKPSSSIASPFRAKLSNNSGIDCKKGVSPSPWRAFLICSFTSLLGYWMFLLKDFWKALSS